VWVSGQILVAVWGKLTGLFADAKRAGAYRDSAVRSSAVRERFYEDRAVLQRRTESGKIN